MQSYDALAHQATKSQFFVAVICGGYMTFVTDKLAFAITVAELPTYRVISVKFKLKNTADEKKDGLSRPQRH